jgi:ATPase subunit of ABC transporter with duplicated ATPase domains
MPATITLSDVTCRTPDGRTLFSHLDLAFPPLRTGLVGRNGVGKSTLLGLITGASRPYAGTVHVAGSIGLLSQSAQVEDGATVADAMGIEAALSRLARLEVGTSTLEDAAEADWTLPQRIEAALAEVGLAGIAPDRRLATLSGGQRTRAALAGLLLAAPDMLLLDEPTNNLDAAGRAAIAGVLARWRGGAIVVSHDRTLLREMDQIVELTTLGAATFGGNYDAYRARKDVELEAAARDLAHAEQHLAEVDRRVQAQTERKARKDATGARRARKGGVPRIMLGGMKRRAEETAASQSRLATRLHETASAEAAEARSRIEVLQPVTAALAPTGLAAGKVVLEAHGLAGGPEGRPDLICGFELIVTGPERIAITGPNGVGKTTLMRMLTGELVPAAGRVALHVPFAMLDQALSLLDPAETVREAYRRLNPQDDENTCRAALARLKFRAEAALQVVGTLSGGEMLRAGLAVTIGAARPPALLALDEPTNHLDLDAIAAVEDGLRGYDGALLVVSHDHDFLKAIGISREIALGANDQTRVKTK